MAYVSPLGRALVDKGLVSARELDLGSGPLCRRRGCPRSGGATGRRRSSKLASGTAGAGPGVGPPQGQRSDGLPETTNSLRDVAGPGLGSPWRDLGMPLRAGHSGQHSGLGVAPGAFVGPGPDHSRGLRGSGAPASPGLRAAVQRRTMEQRSDELPDETGGR